MEKQFAQASSNGGSTPSPFTKRTTADEAVTKVVESIKSLPVSSEITLDHETPLLDLMKDYDNLSEEQRAIVGDELRDLLLDSIKVLSTLKEASETVVDETITQIGKEQVNNVGLDSVQILIPPKQDSRPKRLTHQVISPSIRKTSLQKLDLIAENLEQSRNELLERIIDQFVENVERTKPELLKQKKKR